MPPSPRFIYYHTHTGAWHVYDNLLRRRVHEAASMLAVGSVARDYEAVWRGLCQRWIEAEHREGPPYAA